MMTEAKVGHWIRIILRSIFVLIGLAILYSIREIFVPIIFGIVFAYVLNPLNEAVFKRMPQHTRLYRIVSIIITFLIFILLIFLFFRFVLPPFAKEFQRLTDNLPRYLQETRNFYVQLEEKYLAYGLSENVRVAVERGTQNIAGMMFNLIQQIIASLFGILSQFLRLVMIPILTYYFLLDREKIRDSIVSIFPLRQKERTLRILGKVNMVLNGYVKGMAILCVIVGVITGVGLYLLGMQYALILGLVAGITEAIPIIGPFLGAVPAVLVALFISPSLALKVILLYIVVQAFENNFLVPKILGEFVDLHPVTLIIALLFLGQVLGTLGLFFAAPIAAAIKVIYADFRHHQLHEHG